MADNNPRITVTLKPSTHAALRRLSALTKNSQSAIVGELLESAEPVFERTCLVIEAAQRAQAEVKDRVRANLEAAERVLDEQLGLMLGDLETRSQDMVDGLEEVRRRGGRSTAALPAAAGAPPMANRGGATPQGDRKGTGKRARRCKGRGRS